MTALNSTSIQQQRELARQQAEQLGMPQRRSEAYRYVNLKGLRETAWEARLPAPTADQTQKLESLVKEQAIPGRQTMVFWNGFFLSDLSASLAGLELRTELKEAETQWWSAQVGEVGPNAFATDYFDLMNGSYWGRGALLRVEAGAAAKLQLLFLYSDVASIPAVWIPFQIGVELAAGAHADIFESHIALPTTQGLKSQRWIHPEIRVLVNSKARLQWVQCQNLARTDWCVQRTRFFVKESASVNALHVSIGAQTARQNLDFHVLGEKADLTLNGISLVGPGQVTDFHTLVDHVVGHSTTRQFYKGILGSDSQAVFNGRVVIRKGAQKAASEQLNQNLLLSDRAEIDSKPELEIFADDVKATHGSAIGQLNEDEIFYLLSRGIPRSQAEEMIALGSVVGLLDDIENRELKTRLTQVLSRAYQGIHE